MRSSSNMNISWLSEQKSVGNTGVSQACFLLFFKSANVHILGADFIVIPKGISVLYQA